MHHTPKSKHREHPSELNFRPPSHKHAEEQKHFKYKFKTIALCFMPTDETKEAALKLNHSVKSRIVKSMAYNTAMVKQLKLIVQQ